MTLASMPATSLPPSRSRTSANRQSAPPAITTTWNDIIASDHFVQMYHSDDVLVDAVGGFVAAGLLADDVCIVIATPAHRGALEKVLERNGVDVASCRRRERLIELDAAETLSRFMYSGAPDPWLFRETVGRVVANAEGRGRHIRAFGEMVALLWAEGNHTGAVALESLWNDLAEDHTFCLFCAYPLDICGGDDLATAFADVCHHHRRVIPAESYAALPTTDERLEEIAILQQKALSLEAEVARRIEVEESLRRREAELADFFDNSLESLHKVGPDGTILWANAAELRFLGYSPEEYIGRPIASFHADSDVIRDIFNRLLSGEELYDYPARLKCKDGSIKEVLIHSNGCFENGSLAYTRCFTRDVTERNKMQRALAERFAEIESLNERLKRSMTETHHRIKNNLQVVSAMIDMQAMEHEPEQAVPLEEFARLKTHVRTLAVVHDLLTHSIKEEEDAQCVSTKSVLDKLLPMLQQGAWKGAVTYEAQDVKIPAKQCVSLALIINELVSNALKHGRGSAEVSFRSEGAQAVLEVCDDGAGFPDGFDALTASNTGLELIEAIVRTDLRGEVRYENRPVGGARVRISFDLSVQSA